MVEGWGREREKKKKRTHVYNNVQAIKQEAIEMLNEGGTTFFFKCSSRRMRAEQMAGDGF